jgi:hypothetical protein
MERAYLCWTFRVTAMFIAGVIPAVVLLVFIIVLMPVAAIGRVMLDWLVVMAVLALLGIAGLWGATFQHRQERIMPNGITTVLLSCGLIGALPFFFGFLSDGLNDGGLPLLMTVLLLGPIVCAVYFLVEQLLATLRRRFGASNKSLKGDVAKATRP